jgi:hypothetical protein
VAVRLRREGGRYGGKSVSFPPRQLNGRSAIVFEVWRWRWLLGRRPASAGIVASPWVLNFHDVPMAPKAAKTGGNRRLRL